MLRKEYIQKSKNEILDALILGSGINGSSVASALSSQGLKITLIDKDDFSSGTSQESSNLIWGGIKYLENYEFGLVKNLCDSRNLLMRSYPSSLKEIRFLVSHKKKFRHSLATLYTGTWLYWFLGSRFTKKPQFYSQKNLTNQYSIINTKSCDGAFEYSDAYIVENDARFSFQFVKNTISNGSYTINYLKALSSSKSQKLWKTKVQDRITQETFEIQSKTLINALGPYSDEYNENSKQTTKFKHILSKGIHLIIDKIISEEKVLSFFANDGRLFFVLPMKNRTCIGTTDTPEEKPTKRVTEEDRTFVLENANSLLNLTKPLTKSDIIAERCGVRPLVVSQATKNSSKDWMQLSRKHETEVNVQDKYITLFGGKLTNCVNLGNEICDVFKYKFQMKLPKTQKKWYGEPSNQMKENFMKKAREINLDEYCRPSQEKISERFWRNYELDAFDLIEKIKKNSKLKEIVLNTSAVCYITCEIEYLLEKEMIITLEDFLRRRTNLSLLNKKSDLQNMNELRTVANILFANESKKKWNDYFLNDFN